MAEKTLQTRLLLKYDTYQNWTTDTPETQANKTGANFVLKKGEIGICAIPAARTGDPTVQTPTPTVLFKVGDGNDTPFKNLKWASALAADVYGWAKASDVVLDGKTIKFVGAKNADGTDKVITLNYVTETEVKAITDPLIQRIAAVEAKFSGNNSVEGQISALDGRLDTVEGAIDTLNGDAKTTGSVAKAIADSAAATKTAYEAYADQAEADALAAAKAYVDGENGVKQGLAAHLADKENPHGVTKVQVGLGKVENKSVAEIKTELATNGTVEANKTGFVTGGAVYTAVQAAEQKVTDLANGAVKTNTENIAKNTQDIAKINAFFNAADHDGQEGGLNDALDTLVEIQNFLSGEGREVDQMLDAIDANAKAIDDNAKAIETIEGVLGNGTTAGLVKDNTTNKEAIAGLQGSVSTLNDIVNGYTAKGSIKAAVVAAQGDATKALADAKNAQDAADAAQDGVDAINEILTGEGKLVETVNSHVQDIAGIKTNYIRTDGTKLVYGEDETEIIFNCGDSGVKA